MRKISTDGKDLQQTAKIEVDVTKSQHVGGL